MFSPVDSSTYWPSTAHPISRLPVFVMGIIAGLLRLREDQEATTISSPGFLSLPLSLAHDILPWRFWGAAINLLATDSTLQESKEKQWAWRVDIIMVLSCFYLYIFFFLPQSLLRYCPIMICYYIVEVGFSLHQYNLVSFCLYRCLYQRGGVNF